MHKRGFTLIEVLVGVFIIAVIVLVLYVTQSRAPKSFVSFTAVSPTLTASITPVNDKNESLITTPANTFTESTVSPTPTESVHIVSALQDYLDAECRPTLDQTSQTFGVENRTISYNRLPITIDENILPVSPESKSTLDCISASAESEKDRFVVVQLKSDSNDLFGNRVVLYDDDSQELGHGGAPLLHLYGDTIYNRDSIQISMYYPVEEGGPILPDGLTIRLRGQKVFVSPQGDTFYVNLEIDGTPKSNNGLYAEMLAKYTTYDSEYGAMAIPYNRLALLNNETIKTFFETTTPEMQTLINRLNGISYNVSN
ncbi:prepilin-type N-terminal cleavage/methylation domain-containing protein [candidate division WWE3 bacterium]|nr:prepilin-type N-terminal cleavage/methylation domain-containing protein [candidate division WWE3 bacterium]